MKDQLEKIKEDALKQIEASDALEKLNEIRVAYLGKKGELTSVLKSMKDVPPEERPKVGQMVNDARAIIENRLEEAKASPTPAAPSPSPSPSPAEETPAPAATPVPKPKKEKASAPVKGTLQWPFAMDELVYSETLGQWMTHSGIDIAAPKGTAVYAVWGGRVDRVYTDDALGVMVELDHGDGRISVYGNLDPDLPVEEGQRLQAGDLVGAVGDTAVAECGAAAHLHYELYVDGKAVDPLEYVLLIEE